MANVINEIVVSKSYITNNLKGIPGIEYNNYTTIVLQSLKIHLKYLLAAFIITIVAIVIMFVIIFLPIRNTLNEYIYDESSLNAYIRDYFSSKLEPQFTFIFSFMFLLIFFKLLFVDTILIFKQENYKIKNIVKKSFSIIQDDKIFFVTTYFGINLLLVFLSKLMVKNNNIYVVFSSVVGVCLFMIYLIRFTIIKTNEYNNLKEDNIQLLNFLNETTFLHDSNIENIDIKIKQFEKNLPPDYPKEIFDIDIRIHISESNNRKLSDKIFILSFSNVVEFKISKTDKWEWLINKTKLLQGNDCFKIIIDDFVLIKFNKCKIMKIQIF
jgi:hypothetical protein